MHFTTLLNVTLFLPLLFLARDRSGICIHLGSLQYGLSSFLQGICYYLQLGFVLPVFVSCNVDKSSGYKGEYKRKTEKHQGITLEEDETVENGLC